MDSCFFIGHREAGTELTVLLGKAVERHITEYGVTEFVVGRYGNFDRMAALAVMDAKQRHPGVTLTLLLPYPPFGRPVFVPPGFDGTLYPEGLEIVPQRLAILRANRSLVENCRFLIAYAWHPGNARNLLRYALARQEKGLLRVTNLASKPCAPTTFDVR